MMRVEIVPLGIKQWLWQTAEDSILRTGARVLVNKVQATTLPKILEQERPSLVQPFI